MQESDCVKLGCVAFVDQRWEGGQDLTVADEPLSSSRIKFKAVRTPSSSPPPSPASLPSPPGS